MPLRVEPRRDRKLNRLVKVAEVQSLAAHEALFRPGEPAREVHLVREGHLRLGEGENGALPGRTLAVAGPWELVGLDDPSGTRRLGAVAGEDCRFQALERAEVVRVIQTSSRTLVALLEGLANDLACARWLAGGTRPSAGNRLARVLIDLTVRWGEPPATGKGVLLRQRVTHQVLADLAGLHRSTVTTLLNDWIYRKLLAQSAGGLTVTRPEELARLATDPRAPRRAR